MRIDVDAKPLSVVAGGIGVMAALMLGSPQALADPVVPVPPPPPPAQPVAGEAAPPAEEVPHLASPEDLRPGTTMDPSAATPLENPNISFLKDLWQAVQNKELSGKEAAIIAFSQRGMNTPYPEQAPGPNVPIRPPAPAADLPPAPAAVQPPAPAAPPPPPPAAPPPPPPVPPPPAPPPAPAPLMPWLP